MKNRGFTLIEVVLVMAIIGVLYGLLTINLISSKPKAAQNSAILTLISDIKQQQIKAMTGKSTGGVPGDFGVYFETERYILFDGSAYSASSPTNYIVNLEDNVRFTSINLPSSSIVFSQTSGDIAGFAAGSNSVTISNTLDSIDKTISINRYGVITNVN